MARDILPGYEFSVSAQRYRDLATGRFVARGDVMAQMEMLTSNLESRLGALAQAVAEGNLAPSYFAEQAHTELRRTHLQQRALGAGGWDRLNQSDYGSVGRKLRDDYPRVVTLAQGLTDGTVTLPQAMNRIRGWAGNARLEFMEAERQRRQAGNGMVLLAKRNLGAAEHCPSCVGYYQQGWQPEGVLPLPTQDSECTTHCRCTIVVREVPMGDVGEWIGTRRQ